MKHIHGISLRWTRFVCPTSLCVRAEHLKSHPNPCMQEKMMRLEIEFWCRHTPHQPPTTLHTSTQPFVYVFFFFKWKNKADVFAFAERWVPPRTLHSRKFFIVYFSLHLFQSLIMCLSAVGAYELVSQITMRGRTHVVSFFSCCHHINVNACIIRAAIIVEAVRENFPFQIPLKFNFFSFAPSSSLSYLPTSP